MNTMKVSKQELIDILKTNRDAHRNLFIEAQKVYKELVIKELDAMLEDAKNGSNIRRHVNLKAPQDHTSEYDRLIGLLKLSQDTIVDLNLTEYDNFVKDNWAWSRADNALKMNYTTGNTSPMFVGEDASFASSY